MQRLWTKTQEKKRINVSTHTVTHYINGKINQNTQTFLLFIRPQEYIPLEYYVPNQADPYNFTMCSVSIP